MKKIKPQGWDVFHDLKGDHCTDINGDDDKLCFLYLALCFNMLCCVMSECNISTCLLIHLLIFVYLALRSIMLYCVVLGCSIFVC